MCAMLFMPIAHSASNIPMGNVEDFGSWATEHNRSLFTKNLTDDISAFQSEFQTKVLVKDYVPIEARVGRAFIGALSMVGEVLERSLVRFVSIFIMALFAFWIAFESYHMMTKTHKARELWESILSKAITISIWIFIIEQGPAQLFMWIMGPVISLGTYLSDLILNSIAAASGANLPDTCAAIHKYIGDSPASTAIINAAQTADLLCVPTRLSGFFYTAVAAGWQWMVAGIGTSAFTFLAGLVFVILFAYNIWKFALTALGIIADLFISLFMLPFVAISQTFGGNGDGNLFTSGIDAFAGGSKGTTSYDGIAGKIFNQFTKLFTTKPLSWYIEHFIKTAIYFVALSIVIAVCAAILSGVVDANLASVVPTLDNDGFMVVLIVGCLVAYLANSADEIIKNLGGSIDNSYGKQISGDISNIWKATRTSATNWWKAIRKS